MAGLTDASKNTKLSAFIATIAYVSLHTGDPGGSGTSNEASGGSYARQAISWGTPASGSVSGSSTLSFPVPSGSFTHIAYWSTGPTGGTYQGSRALPATATFASAGTLPVTVTETET